MTIEDITLEDIRHIAQIGVVAFGWAEERYANQEYFLRIFDYKSSNVVWIERDEEDEDALLRKREEIILKAFHELAKQMSAHDRLMLFGMIETARS